MEHLPTSPYSVISLPPISPIYEPHPYLRLLDYNKTTNYFSTCSTPSSKEFTLTLHNIQR